MINNIYIVCLVFLFVIINISKPALSKEKDKEIDYVSPAMSAKNRNNINPVWGFYVDASPGISLISNNNLSSDIWDLESSYGYNLSAGYFNSPAPWIKVKLGIGISSYSTKLTGNNEVQSPQLLDIDNDIYTDYITLTMAEYNVNLLYLTVPLTFEFGHTYINKLGYYVDLGIEYSYLIDDGTTTNGSYSTKGFYPQWGVTLENVPELGYYASQEMESGVSMQNSNYAVRGSAGITIPINGVLIFKLGLQGCMGLKDIGNNQPEEMENSPISASTQDFRSNYIYNPLATTSGSKTGYFGIEFGLYICKRVK